MGSNPVSDTKQAMGSLNCLHAIRTSEGFKSTSEFAFAQHKGETIAWIEHTKFERVKIKNNKKIGYFD